jgi:hypothetical protein
VTLKKFLIRCLPALYNKPKRREAAWREFRKSDTALGSHYNRGGNLVTVKQLADWIAEGNAIRDEHDYVILARSFLSWYADWRKETTSNVRSQSALKRHKKTGARSNRVELKQILKERLAGH